MELRSPAHEDERGTMILSFHELGTLGERRQVRDVVGEPEGWLRLGSQALEWQVMQKFDPRDRQEFMTLEEGDDFIGDQGTPKLRRLNP